MNNSVKLIAVLGTAVLLQACGSSPKKGDVSDSFESGFDSAYSQGSGIQDSTKIQHSIGNAAVVAMWERAEAARLTGDLDGAVSQLERAIRIDPTDAVIWSRMAQLRLEQNNYVSAENIATKSNQLNGGENTVLEYRNWLIMHRARQANGDLTGAQDALQRANAYKN